MTVVVLTCIIFSKEFFILFKSTSYLISKSYEILIYIHRLVTLTQRNILVEASFHMSYQLLCSHCWNGFLVDTESTILEVHLEVQPDHLLSAVSVSLLYLHTIFSVVQHGEVGDLFFEVLLDEPIFQLEVTLYPLPTHGLCITEPTVPFLHRCLFVRVVPIGMIFI